jgi:hypothetical protein
VKGELLKEAPEEGGMKRSLEVENQAGEAANPTGKRPRPEPEAAEENGLGYRGARGAANGVLGLPGEKLAGRRGCAHPCALLRMSRGNKRVSCEAAGGFAGRQGEKNAGCVRERLLREDWGKLLEELTLYARQRACRQRWSGPLPLGYDASGLAAEAIARLFNGECRLKSNYAAGTLRRELERLVRGEIARLHKRTDAREVSSEWVLGRRDAIGEEQSVLEGMAGPEQDGAEVLMEAEEKAGQTELYGKLEAGLSGDEEALRVLRCLREGRHKRADIAAQLGVDEVAVTNARKRLVRKVEELRGCSGLAEHVVQK